MEMMETPVMLKDWIHDTTYTPVLALLLNKNYIQILVNMH